MCVFRSPLSLSPSLFFLFCRWGKKRCLMFVWQTQPISAFCHLLVSLCVSACHHMLIFQTSWSNREKHLQNVTCWAISFDKLSVSGLSIMESNLALEQIRSQMQNYLFIMSVKNTKETTESNERRRLRLFLTTSYSSEAHPSTWCLFWHRYIPHIVKQSLD